MNPEPNTLVEFMLHQLNEKELELAKMNMKNEISNSTDAAEIKYLNECISKINKRLQSLNKLNQNSKNEKKKAKRAKKLALKKRKKNRRK